GLPALCAELSGRNRFERDDVVLLELWILFEVSEVDGIEAVPGGVREISRNTGDAYGFAMRGGGRWSCFYSDEDFKASTSTCRRRRNCRQVGLEELLLIHRSHRVLCTNT